MREEREIQIKTVEAGYAKVYAFYGARRIPVGYVRKDRDASSTRTGFTWTPVHGGRDLPGWHTTREAAAKALVEFEAKLMKRGAK